MDFLSSSVPTKQALACLLLLLPVLARAGDWELKRSVGLNLEDVERSLQAGGTQSYRLLSVRPNFNLSGSGSHITGNFAYSPQLNLRQGYDSGTYVNQFLRASARAELYPNKVFLDASANAGLAQRSTSSAAVDSSSLSNNRLQTYALTLSPKFREHLGTFADLISNNYVRYTTAGPQQTAWSTGFNIGAQSGRRFSRLGWSIFLDTNQVHYQTLSYSNHGVSGQLRYQLTNRLLVLGGVGYSGSSAPSNFTRNSSANWQLGFNWNPDPTTTLSADFGHSYYGNHWQLGFDHINRYTRISASWSKGLANSTSLLAATLQPGRDANGQTVVDPITGQPLSQPLTVLVSSEDNFLQTTTALTVAVTGARTLVTGTLSYTTYQYNIAPIKTDRGMAQLSASRQLSEFNSLTASINFVNIKTNQATGNNSSIYGTIGLNTQLGSRSTLRTYYWREQYHAGAGNGFNENRIGVTLSYRFD